MEQTLRTTTETPDNNKERQILSTLLHGGSIAYEPELKDFAICDGNGDVLVLQFSEGEFESIFQTFKDKGFIKVTAIAIPHHNVLSGIADTFGITDAGRKYLEGGDVEEAPVSGVRTWIAAFRKKMGF